MWVDDISEALGAQVEQGQGHPVAEVAPGQWRAAVSAARDQLGCTYFDWLSAVDEVDAGLRIVVHLWSVADKRGLLLRTLITDGQVESIVDLFPGADWHERETHEMFGVDFPGHPNLSPLLLAPEFEGHPLRKDFVLASRVAKPWPGAKEPGGDHAGPRKRQPMRPPGVPADGEWGPKPAAEDPQTEPENIRKPAPGQAKKDGE